MKLFKESPSNKFVNSKELKAYKMLEYVENIAHSITSEATALKRACMDESKQEGFMDISEELYDRVRELYVRYLQ